MPPVKLRTTEHRGNHLTLNIEIVITAAIGLFAGLTGGLLGVGGSIVIIPALTEFFAPDQHRYQAAAMVVNFFVVVPAVYQHRRAGAIDRATVLRLIPMSVAAVVVGVGLSELPLFAASGERYLRGLFGLFLLAVGGYDLYRLVRRRPDPVPEKALLESDVRVVSKPFGWWETAKIAIPVGLFAGMLGVGGGLLAVPLQRRVLGLPIRTAIANSAAVIIATSSIGGLVKNMAYAAETARPFDPLTLAAVLIPGAILGSFVGSRWTHVLPLRTVKAAFFVLLCVAGARLTYGAFHISL